VQVDVAIIGGGFTGVATAVELAERGLKVAIVETNRIGWGASGRNGGQVTGSLSGDEAMRNRCATTWRRSRRFHLAPALARAPVIEQRVERYGIDCDLKHGHLHAAMKPSHMNELRGFEEARAAAWATRCNCSTAASGEHLQSPLYLAR
jgi:glycine/D-amino acid oxidase-like deaminating enzyme